MNEDEAGMVKQADTEDLKSSALIKHEGSTPSSGTICLNLECEAFLEPSPHSELVNLGTTLCLPCSLLGLTVPSTTTMIMLIPGEGDSIIHVCANCIEELR